MTPPRPSPPAARLTPALQASLVLLAGLTAALSAVLWPHWQRNPDLSHGWFMPVIFLYLLAESRRGPARYLRAGAVTTGVQAALLAAGLLALTASGLYAVSLGWSHDVVAFTLTGALVLLLAAGLVGLAADDVRWLPCNWSAGVALGLWLLCAPLPPGTYSRLTLHLQLLVSENVLRALHLLGIAAAREGNILQLANATVGIEDACSGVRSLISCVFAGLFLSATLVRRPGSRAGLILLSAPLALGMNLLRSLTLTLLAGSGHRIAGAWHDLTGFAVLGLTAALLAGWALLLEAKPAAAPPPPAAPDRAPVARGAGRLLVGALLTAVALAACFAARTRPASRPDAPVPDLAAFLPAAAAGWQVEPGDDLAGFRSTLQTEHLAQRTYLRPTDHGPERVTLYLAYWRPGQASVSLVASHTPDACWPGAGWEPRPVSVPRVRLALANRTLAAAEARAFRSGPEAQNVWYWHLYAGRPLSHQDPNSPAELLRLAWRYGFRRDGDQLFVRVSSNLDWAAIRDEPFLVALFARLQPLGL